MTPWAWWRWLAEGLLAGLLALLALGARASDEPPRQLLVMLQLPKAHYRPDSSYAGAYGDGVGLQARKQVAQELARQHELQLESEWPMPLIGVDCFVMRLSSTDGRSPVEVARHIASDTRVAWAQPVNTFVARGSEAEPLYPTQPVARQWHLADLHTLATGLGVRVAVIDSGVAAGHPDLSGQLVLNQNFVDAQALQAEDHGTAVAGVIAARADNHLGIAGVAPGARLMALRACWQAGGATLCNSLSLAKALQTAVQQGAQIVNMSLSGPEDRLLGMLVDQALARGATVVAALGSADQPFPASHPGVLKVAAAPPLPAGAVLAPGRDIPATAADGGWTLVSGSSFSAAHATGLLALVKELDRSGRLRRLQDALVMESSGRINTCATLLNVGGGHRPCGLVPAEKTPN